MLNLFKEKKSRNDRDRIGSSVTQPRRGISEEVYVTNQIQFLLVVIYINRLYLYFNFIFLVR